MRTLFQRNLEQLLRPKAGLRPALEPLGNIALDANRTRAPNNARSRKSLRQAKTLRRFFQL